MRATQCMEINDIHGITVVHLLDHRLVDGIAIDDLAQELYQLIESDGRRNLVLELSSVNFMSSVGLEKLIVLYKKVKAHGGTLRLCCIRPDVRGVFTVTKLDRLFDIWDTEAEALAAFRPSRHVRETFQSVEV